MHFIKSFTRNTPLGLIQSLNGDYNLRTNPLVKVVYSTSKNVRDGLPVYTATIYLNI